MEVMDFMNPITMMAKLKDMKPEAEKKIAIARDGIAVARKYAQKGDYEAAWANSEAVFKLAEDFMTKVSTILK